MDQEIQEQNSAAANVDGSNGVAPASRPRTSRAIAERRRKRGRSTVWATAKQNGFIFALLCAVGLAFFFPFNKNERKRAKASENAENDRDHKLTAAVKSRP